MTSAVQQALALGHALDRNAHPTARLARQFYRAARRILATPWQFAAGGDFLYPQTTGPKPFGMDLFNGYARRLNRACALSPEIQAPWRG